MSALINFTSSSRATFAYFAWFRAAVFLADREDVPPSALRAQAGMVGIVGRTDRRETPASRRRRSVWVAAACRPSPAARRRPPVYPCPRNGPADNPRQGVRGITVVSSVLPPDVVIRLQIQIEVTDREGRLARSFDDLNRLRHWTLH